jgi:hypothetical protein
MLQNPITVRLGDHHIDSVEVEHGEALGDDLKTDGASL